MTADATPAGWRGNWQGRGDLAGPRRCGAAAAATMAAAGDEGSDGAAAGRIAATLNAAAVVVNGVEQRCDGALSTDRGMTSTKFDDTMEGLILP
ncbi:hypothetical protein Syun_002378 [Stephania yunnanensis]|uniref:Uncharacterized protein n=1 Tax=Stephania yunnanensis TaxID=152371 RepID=A0AAP0LGG8_9MAGN